MAEYGEASREDSLTTSWKGCSMSSSIRDSSEGKGGDSINFVASRAPQISMVNRNLRKSLISN